MSSGATSWKVTAPSTWPFCPFDRQMIRLSGSCSRIVDSQIRRDQKTFAVHSSFSSDFCSTPSTFFMKLEKSPNWVHWS